MYYFLIIILTGELGKVLDIVSIDWVLERKHFQSRFHPSQRAKHLFLCFIDFFVSIWLFFIYFQLAENLFNT